MYQIEVKNASRKKEHLEWKKKEKHSFLKRIYRRREIFVS